MIGLIIFIFYVAKSEAMEIEIEMATQSEDVSEILQKVIQVVNSAKEQGFVIKELEIESDDDETEEGE